MKIKTANIHYYIRHYDEGEYISYDIFNLQLLQRIAKLVKSGDIKNRLELKEMLNREFRSRFWCRCEWENILISFPPKKDEEGYKADAYKQISPNLDLIVDQVINKMELKF